MYFSILLREIVILILLTLLLFLKILRNCLTVNCKLEHRVEKAQEEFDAISKSIRKEVERFELQRYHDFKAAIISYLESVLKNQQQVCSSVFRVI